MAGEPRSINDFVDEIMLKILSYIGPEDLCFIIAKVCDRWNGLAKDVTLWKTLSYSCDPTSDISHVDQVLRKAPALHSLIIRKRKDAVRILGILFDRRVELRKLHLKDCYLREDGTGILANILTFYPDLEALSLVEYQPLQSAVFSVIPRLKKLTELNLALCQELSGKTVRIIADSCQHLKKLSLQGCYHFKDDDVIHVIKKLGKQLTTLVLDAPLTDVAYLYLNNCARLQKLEVSSCGIMTDRGLLEGIGSLRELTSLCLKLGYELTAQALSTFLRGPCMTSIVSLYLSSCYNLDDEALKGIAKRCIHLKELALIVCNVTDAGISMVISHCNQLRILNLLGLEYITGNGCLALVPSHLPHLRLLSLWKCDSVCDEYIEELVAAAPELVVINPLGKVVGGLRKLQLEAVCSELELNYVTVSHVYDIIRQWALNR